MKSILKNSRGFTLIELIVSSSVIIIMLSFALANFHAARRSGELDVVNKQVIDGVATVRNFSLGGKKITNPTPPPAEVFPAGGYGINFKSNESKFTLYASFDPAATKLVDGVVLNEGVKNFSDISITTLCTINVDVITSLPCQSGWSSGLTVLEIIFDISNNVFANDANGPLTNVTYVGGVLRHNITGQQSYFYISLISGLVAGDLL